MPSVTNEPEARRAPDVLRFVTNGRQRLHISDSPVRFAGDGLLGRAADDQVCFDPGFLQQFEDANAQNGTTGPGDRQNDSFHAIPTLPFSPSTLTCIPVLISSSGMWSTQGMFEMMQPTAVIVSDSALMIAAGASPAFFKR